MDGVDRPGVPGVRPGEPAPRRVARRPPVGAMPWRGVASELSRVRPAPGAPRVALRATVTLLVALLVLLGLGRIDLAVYATFGAFASVYGGATWWPGRWRVQAALAGVLCAAVACGVVVALGADRAWTAIPVAACWAGLAAAWSDRYRWVPRGPMFPVFAVATCAAIPIAPGQAAPAVGVACATAGLALALGGLEGPATRRGRPSPGRRPERYPVPDVRRRTVHALRCAAAVSISGTVATGVGIGRPYWAMVASVVPLGVPGLIPQLVRGTHRLVGTLVGLLVAAALMTPDLPPLAVVIVVALLQGATELVVVRHYGTALVFVTPLALLLGQLARPQPVGSLLAERLAETVIGVVVGVGVAVVTRVRR